MTREPAGIGGGGPQPWITRRWARWATLLGVILGIMTLAGRSAAITNAPQVADQGTAPEYYWTALNTGGRYTVCTAVLVTPARMITAAHCVNGDQNIPFATSNFGLMPTAVIYFSRGSAVAQDNLTVFNTFTPDVQNHPDYKWVAWDKNKPMQFDWPNTTLDDLAVIPLDYRVTASEAVRAELPFDPDGTLHPCSSSFTGRFRGYAGYELTEATGSTDIATYYFPSGFGPYAERYSNDIGFFDFLPTIGNVFDLLQGSNLLEHGDSGGPLYQGDKLCGINSERVPFEPDCTVDPFAIPPDPPIKCHIYAENWHTRVDTQDARDFLLPLLVDSAGNWIGTCGGKGNPNLQDVDTDHDLIPDACDPCPGVYDKKYHDTGVYTDYPDSDGDGIPDICDACPNTGIDGGDTGRVLTPALNPAGFRWAQPDADGDGIGDACDTCPYSDVREAADTGGALQSDWVCCNTDADCSPATAYGDHTSRCMPIDPGATLAKHPEVGFAPNACSGYKGRCSLGKDADGDGTSDQCDNCPGQFNTHGQTDTDGDGVGDDCDNCPGTGDATGEYPGEHKADRNDYVAPVDPAIPGYTPPDMICAGDGVPDPAGDAYCKGLNSQGRCVPGKANGFFLEPALCSKFPDKDGDSVGDACDNCPDTPNHQLNLTGVSPGTLNGQPNCNLLAEVAGGMPYPYIGDACDPSPCNRPDRQPTVAHGGLYPGDWVDDGTHGDLWRIISYDPQILPDSYAASFRSPETSFKNKYTPGGTPVARVGARVCDCGADPNTGLLRNAWQCHVKGICPIKPILYNYQDAGIPADQDPFRVVKTYVETSTDLQASPLTPPEIGTPLAFGLDGKKGEVSPLALEAAAGTTPTTTGFNPDNLSPFLESPTWVAWDLTASQATEQGILGYGILGVFWTAVRDVPQVLPGTPAGTTKPFTDWSNKYSSGFAGLPRDISSGVFVKSTCPFCDLGACPYCLERICMACLTSPEARSLVISPATQQVFAQTSGGALDITSEFSLGALEAVSATGTRWVTSAERGGWIGAHGLAFSVLSTDGTTVEATLVAGADGTEGVTLLGVGRIVGSPEVAASIPVAGSPSPPPRSDFGAVLSGREQGVFVIGGELQSGGLAGDLWMYDLTDATWSQLPFTGPAPQKVLASTYIADTRSLYVVDQTDQNPVLARLLRYDFATGAFVELGQWPRTVVFDRVELSGSYEGNLLLSGSSKLTHHVAGVVLRPSADKVKVIGAFLRKGVLAVEPTLGATALTLPLVSESSSGSTNTVIPTKEVFFPTHEKPQHQPQGPPCNDYRCPPHLTIGDVL